MFNLTPATMALSQNSVPATQTQIAAITAFVKPAGVLAPQFANLAAVQIAGVLNATELQANPLPSSVGSVVYPKEALHVVLMEALLAAYAKSPTTATVLQQKYRDLINFVVGWPDTTLPLSIAQAIDTLVVTTDALLNQQQVAAGLVAANVPITAFVAVGSWAIVNLGGIVEVADITTATTIQ